eukprot:2254971-Rhodomonas_salina.1
MPGTGAACYAVSGTDLAYAATPGLSHLFLSLFQTPSLLLLLLLLLPNPSLVFRVGSTPPLKSEPGFVRPPEIQGGGVQIQRRFSVSFLGDHWLGVWRLV